MALYSPTSSASVPFRGTKFQQRIIACFVNPTVHCVMQWFDIWLTAGAVIADFITVALNTLWIILGIINIFKIRIHLSICKKNTFHELQLLALISVGTRN